MYYYMSYYMYYRFSRHYHLNTHLEVKSDSAESVIDLFYVIWRTLRDGDGGDGGDGGD
jgi:hypothetical protein